jgi:putative FmdB family regulatory protein
MPIYTFACIACDISKEEQLKIADRDSARIECPQCGNKMIRAMDRPGLVWAPTAGGMK